ncbi:SMP-30/gluconolactonase/LRE family protein, partial [Pseudomonas fluorescens]
QALYWVDIAGFKACRLHGERYQEWQLDRPCSAFVPTACGDALVTLPDGVFRLDLDSPESRPALELFCVADPDPGNRGNEARCDAQGRLWLGT